jgi:diadenosine tetraphosphate (Ap4A) HIT family hydrolase
MKTLIHERVEAYRRGENPAAIARLASGFAVMGDWQMPLGWTLLLPDPVVPTLNDLDEDARRQFLSDMAALGDAVLAATGCARCNYEMLGNQEPALHAHVFARWADEPVEMRTQPIWLYTREVRASVPFAPSTHGEFMQKIHAQLRAAGRVVAA